LQIQSGRRPIAQPDGDGATDALALPPRCLRAALLFTDGFSAMRNITVTVMSDAGRTRQPEPT
jgi:hypothetical protein